MGDYSFFIKSASFILLLNAAIFSFPDQVEALTGGKLNTSSISGTNISINTGFSLDNNEDVVDLGEPLDQNNMILTQEGYLTLADNADSGYATYNISKFDVNDDGLREIFIDADSQTTLTFDALRLEVDLNTDSGVKTFNDTLKSPDVIDNVVSDKITFYFPFDQAVVRSIEDSTDFEHVEERSSIRQLANDIGGARFAQSLDNVVSLYTRPETGNRVLGAVFTLYLLGFIVFLLKEVLPG